MIVKGQSRFYRVGDGNSQRIVGDHAWHSIPKDAATDIIFGENPYVQR